MVDTTARGGFRGFDGFTIGSVLSRTFRVLGMAPLRFMIIAVFPVLPIVLQELAKPPGAPNSKSYFLWAGLAVLAQTILAYLAQAATAYGSFRLLRNESFGLGGATAAGLPRLLPLLGAIILSLLIIVIGFVLLIVPGVIASLALIVVVPACTIERLGSVASLRRSAALTKGWRWRILAADLIIVVPSSIVVFAVTALVTKAAGLVPGQLAGAVAQVALSALSAVFVATLYYELREARNGTSVGTLSDVFS